MIEDYWFCLTHSVISHNADNISLTFKDGNGDPLDISGWTRMVYRATAQHTTDTIDIPASSITLYDSGTGTTDSLLIPFSSTDTAVDQGKYSHELSVTVALQDRTIFRGTLTVLDRIATVV